MGPEFGLNGPKLCPNNTFCYFIELESSVFLEFAYNDSLRQHVTSSRGKTHEKKICGLKFGLSGPKLGPKLGFSLFSQVWLIIFPLNSIG